MRRLYQRAPHLLKRHKPFLAHLVFSNEKSCFSLLFPSHLPSIYDSPSTPLLCHPPSLNSFPHLLPSLCIFLPSTPFQSHTPCDDLYSANESYLFNLTSG